MSLQRATNEQSLARPSYAVSNAGDQNKSIKVLIPYDGSESAETALDDLRRAGLPPALDTVVAVTNVWLPLSPYEITRAVSARRMKVLTAGASSFAPALRDYEEQRVLSLEAERRISSIFPLGTVKAEVMQDTATLANEIVRKAKQWGAELIIVGSNTSPSAHITDYAGPALKVAREAHCSVRISRASDRKDDFPIRIIVGLDGSAALAARVVDAVADRAWPQGSEIRLVVVRKDGPRDPRKDSETMVMLEQAAQELRAKDLTVSIAIRDGKPQDVLLHEARRFSADCIFIDSRGLSRELDEGYERPGIGKAAEALALGAHCSVEVVRANNFGGPHLKPAA
ncbi:MAG TPA: universal stress protein [Pyrinomonadaceae bacterium]|nr:universal stress protein [Pyrinomonadaceae bacterium]